MSARFDKVYVLGGGGGIRIPCRIETIRPLDVKALKQAQREMREAKVVEREAASWVKSSAVGWPGERFPVSAER